MRTMFPRPLLTLGLMVMWLMLHDSFAPADVLVGLLMGVGGAAAYARLEPPRGRMGRSVVAAMVLTWWVLIDIIRSNIAVLRIALRLRTSGRIAGFLSIPLQLRDPRGLAVLACIVTATPGTSWARYEATANVLTLHVLDLVEEDAWVRQFKDRYERRLMEIFP